MSAFGSTTRATSASSDAGSVPQCRSSVPPARSFRTFAADPAQSKGPASLLALLRQSTCLPADNRTAFPGERNERDKAYRPSQYGEPGAAGATSSNLPLACSAEAIGTFLLVLVGTAVATAAVLGKGTAGPAYNSLAVALSFGLILIPIVGSLGQVSGAHVNPAVTFGLALAGKFPWAYVAPYWAAQLVGATVGAIVVWAAYGQGAYVDARLGAPSPVNGASAMQVLLVEALIAFILVFTVVSTTTDKRVPPGSVLRSPSASRWQPGAPGRPVQRRRRQPGARAGADDRRGDLSGLVLLLRGSAARRRRCRACLPSRRHGEHAEGDRGRLVENDAAHVAFRLFQKNNSMRMIPIPAALLAAVAAGVPIEPAQATECIEGAVAEGPAGRVVRHGVLGAAGEYFAGRSIANRSARRKQREQQNLQTENQGYASGP